MPFSPKSLEEKPYNLCLNCAKIGKSCDGPNFFAMSQERWCEWCRLRKEYLGWTNEMVAEKSGASLMTVRRVMSKNSDAKDFRFSSMQDITKALVNGTWGQYPCSTVAEADVIYRDTPELVARFEAAKKECTQYEERIAFFKSQIAVKDQYLTEKDRQLAEKDKQLAEKDKLIADQVGFVKRKNRVILWLALGFALAMAVIIAALVIDKLNPDIGFLWVDKLSTVFSSKTSSAMDGLNNIKGWGISL